MIAVSITAETPDAALADIKEANEKADLIELRLDFLEELTESILEELIGACAKPVIATFRQKNYGASVEDTERMFMLVKAVEFGASYIDLDFDSDTDFFQDMAAAKGNAKIILSCHFFDSTPSLQGLLFRARKMLALGNVDVLKVVAFAKTDSDNGTMLGFLKAAAALGKPVIAFCMGPKGIKSRIACIKMGAFLTFASLEKGKEAAPGQLSVDEMRRELKK